MAAPSNTKWGSIVTGSKSTRKGRIGIALSYKSYATYVDVTVSTWFWSMYSVDDSSNKYYYNAASSATTLIGSIDINHTVASGSGWSTSNQTKLGQTTYRYYRTTSASTKYFSAKLTGIDTLYASSVMTVSTSLTIDPLASYTVSYNANNGSGAPSAQTKWYGTTLKLSSTKPTRTGYSFQGWGTSASDTSVDYAAGANYTANAKITLYAIWKANTYTVKYDANGGSGVPSSQTKTYGVTLTLSSTVPTRQYYNFLGWATSATATSATYKAGGSYTTNAGTTLYAVWKLAYVKPRINNAFTTRCKIDTTTEEIILVDEGTSALVSFDWATDFEVTSIIIEWKKSIDENWSDMSLDVSGTSGSVRQVIGSDDITSADALSTENTYDLRITVTDTESFHSILSLSAMLFPIDVYKKGKGIAFGKTAELEDVLDIGFQTRMMGGILNPVLEPETDLDDIRTPNTYVGANISNYNYINCPLTSGTFTLDVISAGEDGQVKQRIQTCSKTQSKVYERYYYSNAWGDWLCTSDWDGALLASPGMYMTGSHIVELSEPISKQPHGVKLVFSLYSDGVSNSEWVIHDVPKYMIINHPSGGGYAFECNTSFRNAIKYLYIKDTEISGHNNNGITMTVGGITYTNNSMVLRYVIGY